MRIAIIGCGYIGTALAIKLSKKHLITATTRSKNKVKQLNSIVQKSIILNDKNKSELSLIIRENDLIILTVAADDLYTYKNTYLQTARSIRQAASNIKEKKKIIYTSNASIYGHQNGFWVDEKSSPNPIRDQDVILYEAENVILSLQDFDWDVTIFRLGEIYGPGRELIHKKQYLLKYILKGLGNYYTNMIHQEDIIGAITYSIAHNLTGVYNLADDDHPTKENFHKMIQTKIPKTPTDYEISCHHDKGNKRVSNYKIKSQGFVFKHPNRRY